jgi:hypothetical protein
MSKDDEREQSIRPQAEEDIGPALPKAVPPEVPITSWLEEQAAMSTNDAETLAWLKEKAKKRQSYAELAQSHGLTETTLKERVSRFVDKYSDRRKRVVRDRIVLVLLLLLGAGIVYAIVRVL